MNLERQFLTNFLQDLAKSRVTLPSLPEVALQVRKAINNPDTTAKQVAKLINLDAALSARLLKVVNSPAFRGADKIDNVLVAVTRLGNDKVRTLVNTLVMQQLYQAKGTKHTKERMKTLWSHSAKVAALSYVIARRFTRLKPDLAMLAGLVHDIGVLPILSRAESFPELVANKAALEEVIQHLHTVIGPIVLEDWGFSPELAVVAGQHEDAWRNHGPEVGYVDVVAVANLHSYLGTTHHCLKRDWVDVPAFTKLGLTPEQSLLAMEDAREELQEMRQLLTA